MANNSTATYDISNLNVARGHDSLKVTWDGFYNISGGQNIRNSQQATGFENAMPWLASSLESVETGHVDEISGWEDTSFGQDSEAANQFNFSAGEKIAISVLDASSGVFVEQNKVILSHTDVSNINEYEIEGLTAGKNYTVNLKAYKTDTSGTLRIYAEDKAEIPYTNPGMIAPVVSTTDNTNVTVTLPGFYSDYFGTGLPETGYSALNYISVVIVEDGGSDIEISNFVADDSAADTDRLSWSFDNKLEDKTYNVRLDYENNTGVLMSTPIQQVTVGSIEDINSLSITTTGYHEISIAYDGLTLDQNITNYQTKFEFKATDSYATSAIEFKDLPVLGSKVYSMTETPNDSNPPVFLSLDLTQYGVNADKKLLEITSCYVVNNKEGAKKSVYAVLLPQQSTPWADMPPLSNFQLIRQYKNFDISDSGTDAGIPSWIDDLSGALVNSDHLAYLTGLGEVVLNDITTKFDFSNNALLAKDTDTSRFNSGEDDEIVVDFGAVDGESIIGSTGNMKGEALDYGTDESFDFSANNVVNVWKQTKFSVDTPGTDVSHIYAYTAYQVKDREFIDDGAMTIYPQLTQNQNVASLSWSGAVAPTTLNQTESVYYFVGLSAEPISPPTLDAQAQTPDVSYNALPGFALTNKNQSTSATFTAIADNSYNVFRVRPYFTITNSDGTKDDISGNTTDVSFLPHKFSSIDVKVGVPGTYEDDQVNYPFGADSGLWASTLLEDGNDEDLSQVILLKLSGGAGGVEERGAGRRGEANSTGAGYGDEPGASGSAYYDMSLNFHFNICLYNRDGTLSGDISHDFSTADMSGYTLVDQRATNTGAYNNDWGISGEYYICLPTTPGQVFESADLLEISDNKSFKVTLTQTIHPRDGLATISSEPITFNLYGKPSDIGNISVSAEILDDVSGNKANITGNLDISMMNLGAEFANSVKLYRDDTLIKTINPKQEEILGEIYTQDTTAFPGSAHYYNTKTNYDGNFWKPSSYSNTIRDIVPYPINLKDYGFTNIDISVNNSDPSACDISLTVKALPHSMYKSRVTMSFLDDSGERKAVGANVAGGISAKKIFFNTAGGLDSPTWVDADITEVFDANSMIAGTHGVFLSAVDLSDCKYIDMSYSVDLKADVNGETHIVDNFLTKEYRFNNYANMNPTKVVVKAIHTDDDNVPDLTLLDFKAPINYQDAGDFDQEGFPAQLNNYTLTTNNGDIDVSLVGSGGQIVPKSSNYVLKTNYVPTYDDITTSMVMHGESGLDAIINRNNDSGVSLSMPTASTYGPPTEMNMIDFGDLSGVLKIKVPSDVVGLVLYQTSNSSTGGSIEVSGLTGVEVLDVSATQPTTNTTHPAGYVGTGFKTIVGDLANTNSSFDGPDYPPGYLDLSFTNAGGEDYYFWISQVDGVEFGDSLGARFIYSAEGARAVSDLTTVPFFSIVTPSVPTGQAITNIKGSSNKVTFKCDEAANVTEYKVEIYQVAGVEANSMNDYNIWDPSGTNVDHDKVTGQTQGTVLDRFFTTSTVSVVGGGSAPGNSATRTRVDKFKNVVWNDMAANPQNTPIVGQSTSSSEIVVESSLLQPNLLYVARIKSINQGVEGPPSDALLFDMHDTPESPTITVNVNVGGKATRMVATVPIVKQAYMHDITLNHKLLLTDTNGDPVIPSHDNDDLAAALSQQDNHNPRELNILEGVNKSDRKFLTIPDNFDATSDTIEYGFQTIGGVVLSSVGSAAHAARIRGSSSTSNVIALGTAPNLNDFLVQPWTNTLQFSFETFVSTTALRGSFHDLTPPEIVVAIHPHWLSDAPIVYSAPCAIFSQKVPNLTTPSKVFLSDDTINTADNNAAMTVARNEIQIGPSYSNRGVDSERNHTPDHAILGNDGPVDTLFMVVEYESALEEGTVVLTRNRPLNDPDWTVDVINKRFTVDNLPAGAMITSVQVFPVNEFGAGVASWSTATFVLE